jgi:hypothetical protein
VKEDGSQLVEVDSQQERPPNSSVGYDSYRGVADPNLIIFVPKDAVPPFRLKFGGWEPLQSSIDVSPVAKARIAEEGFFIETANPTNSSGISPGDHDSPESPSLEVELALFIARMIDSIKDSPEDIRQIVYVLARCELQDRLRQAKSAEAELTRMALEGAIRGVEAFSQKQGCVAATQRQPHLNDPNVPSTDRELLSSVDQ